MNPTSPRALLAALLLALAACSAPPSHVTRLWPQGVQGKPVVGLSTEEGVLVLADRSYRLGDLFDVQFPVGNSRVDEVGELIRINDNLGVVQPLSARLLEGRFATERPAQHEQLFVALRDADDEPLMQPVAMWRDGARGDLIVPPIDACDDVDTVDDFALRTAGAGVYVYRHDSWEIVGMMSGLVVELADPGTPDEAATSVGFIGLDELRRAVSDGVDYVTPRFLPRRTDFEFGVERQPGDVAIDALRTLNPDAPAKTAVKPAPGAGDEGFLEGLLGGAGEAGGDATTAPSDPADDVEIDFLELLQREAERAAGGTGDAPATDDGGADAPADDGASGDAATDDAPEPATEDPATEDPATDEPAADTPATGGDEPASADDPDDGGP